MDPTTFFTSPATTTPTTTITQTYRPVVERRGGRRRRDAEDRRARAAFLLIFHYFSAAFPLLFSCHRCQLLVTIVVLVIACNSSFLLVTLSYTAEPAYSYNVYSRFSAIVELNLVPFAFVSLLFNPCYDILLL